MFRTPVRHYTCFECLSGIFAGELILEHIRVCHADIRHMDACVSTGIRDIYIYIYMHLWVLNVYMMDASYSCIHVCNVGIIHMDI